MLVFLVERRRSRICSPMGVPPGSRRRRILRPWDWMASMRSFIWVVLPQPSGPSKTMNLPGRRESELVWDLAMCILANGVGAMLRECGGWGQWGRELVWKGDATGVRFLE